MVVEGVVYDSTPVRERRSGPRDPATEIQPMSDESVPGSVGVEIASAQPAEMASGPSEFDPGYYGWRVVLAACLGVMAGFGSLFVYTFSVFVKPLAAEFGWSREAISSGFAIAAVTLGMCSPLLGRWIDRFGPRRIILICMSVYVCAIASLSLLRFGLWQFYVTCFVLGAVGNGAAHLAYSRSISTWFHRRLGTALALVMVGAGLGAMILPVVAQSIISRSGWRAAYASLGALALLLGLPLSLALHPRARGRRPRVRSYPPLWNDMAARLAFLSFLDSHCHPLRELAQYERSDHSPVRVADRSRSHSRKCCTVRLHTRWIQPAGQGRGGMAAGPIFRSACRIGNQPHYRTRDFSPRSGEQLPGGLPCCCAHWHRGGRRSRDYTLSANTLFWPACLFHPLRSHLDVLCRCGSHWAGDPGTR